jgi:hypothetical protein
MYNRRHYLRRVLKAQIIVRRIQDAHPGLPLSEIYRRYIRDEFNISKSTYDKWMGLPAAKELSKIEKE